MTVRLHYLDNLRGLAMLLGLFFHAAIAYSPLMDNLWMSASTDNSVILDSLAFFTHMFRMELFFFIAGFFAILLIEKRGTKEFLKNRGKRILAPFLIFLPLIQATVIGGIIWAIRNVEKLSPMLQFIAEMANNPDATQPPFSTMHLWFLFNLFMFCIVIAVINKTGFLNSPLLTKLVKAETIILVFPLFLIPSLYSQIFPHPAPERIYPELWSFGFYGLFFLLGAMVFHRQQLLDDFKKYGFPLFLLSIVLYSYYYLQMPVEVKISDMIASINGPTQDLDHLIASSLEAYISVFMTIVCLVAGQRYLNKKNRVIRYIADSSYWIYILHLPLLFYIQYLLLDVHWNLWIEFTISVLGTFFIGLITYTLLIRSTPIGTLLNGKRHPFLS